jgi:DNA-binding MarR family transcriptional regulator
MYYMDEPVTAAEIAIIKRMNPATLTRGVAKLEASELLVRKRASVDKRIYEMELTPKGRALVNRYQRIWSDIVREVEGDANTNQNEFIAIFHVLYKLRNRATAFAQLYNLRIRNYNARMPPEPQKVFTLNSLVLADPNYFFQIFCNQISFDYLVFLKKHVIRKLLNYEGMNLQALRVLVSVHFNRNISTPNDVALLLRIDPATVTRAVSRLEALGKLTRSAVHDDGRCSLLRITDEGQLLAEEFRRQTKKAFSRADEILGFEFSNKDRGIFILTLEKRRLHSEAFLKMGNLDGEGHTTNYAEQASTVFSLS